MTFQAGPSTVCSYGNTVLARDIDNVDDILGTGGVDDNCRVRAYVHIQRVSPRVLTDTRVLVDQRAETSGYTTHICRLWMVKSAIPLDWTLTGVVIVIAPAM